MIVLDNKYAMRMAKNDKDTKYTRHIVRRVHFVRSRENVICTRLIGEREVCNWQTLVPQMLVILI